MHLKDVALCAPGPGKCRVCATVHEKWEPHRANSFYYMYRFYRVHRRFPTKEDAEARDGNGEARTWAHG